MTVHRVTSVFAGFRLPPEVISIAVRWYLRYGLSYRDVEELLAERGITLDHVTVYRWVQRFTCGVEHKVRLAQRIHTPAAHVARRPAVSGDGRLRANFATVRRARSAYSSSRTARHAASVMATISSATSRSALGTFS
jgi:hypothetical protein